MRTIFLLLTLMSMFSCKKDNIDLDGGRSHIDGGLTGLFAFHFDDSVKDDNYTVAVDASDLSPNLKFYHQKGVLYDHARTYLGNKGAVKWGDDKTWRAEDFIRIYVDMNSIQVGKEYKFKTSVYKNDRMVDSKIITFVPGLLDHRSSDDFPEWGCLKKICFSNWKNMAQHPGKSSFIIHFKYPKGIYDGKESLKEAKRRYDDCYIEDPDSDKY